MLGYTENGSYYFVDPHSYKCGGIPHEGKT